MAGILDSLGLGTLFSGGKNYQLSQQTLADQTTLTADQLKAQTALSEYELANKYNPAYIQQRNQTILIVGVIVVVIIGTVLYIKYR